MKKARKILAAVLCLAVVICCVPATALAELTPATNLPSMYITLDGELSQSQIPKDDYVTATCSMVGAEGYDDLADLPLSIKGRGNTTWWLEKKPYALKFDSKVDLLGMGKAKKWCLLANYWDKTLMRNYLVQELAIDCGVATGVECKFVDLYVNGNYRGNYLLTEKVEIGKERVNVDDETGGTLWEIEVGNRHDTDGHTYCHETELGVHMVCKEPEVGDLGEEAMSSLMAANNTYIDNMEASLTQGYDAYSQYIDVDSFINWYIVNEFAKNFDSAFVSSVYCYRDAGGKIFMGPCWDFDTCMGNQNVLEGLDPTGYRVNSAQWITCLLDDPDFVTKLHSRYTELCKEGVFDKFFENIQTTKEYILASQALDQKKWPKAMELDELRPGTGLQYFTYNEEISYMTDFMKQRYNWLNTQWNNDYMNGFEALSPINNSTQMFTATSGKDGLSETESYDKLFDGKATTKYCVQTDNQPLIVNFESAEPVTLTRYGFSTCNDTNGVQSDTEYFNYSRFASRNPQKWKLYGSSDGENYTLLDERDSTLRRVSYACDEFRIAKPVSCKYYRLEIDAMRGGSEGMKIQDNEGICQISEFFAVSDTVLNGDTNLDGKVSSVDALLALRSAVGKDTLVCGGAYAADADANGEINSEDALKILQYSVGTIESFC